MSLEVTCFSTFQYLFALIWQNLFEYLVGKVKVEMGKGRRGKERSKGRKWIEKRRTGREGHKRIRGI